MRRIFKENVRVRMEGNTSGWEKPRDNIMEAGREICGETTGRVSRRKKPGGGTRLYSNELKKRTKRIKSGKKVGKRQTEKHASIR